MQWRTSNVPQISKVKAVGLGAAPNGGGGGSKKPLYVYSRFGNAADATPVLPLNSSGLALVGGGTDVDEVFRWMGGKAQGGDFLVLRATGTYAYNSNIDRLASFNSVATLIVPDLAAAFDPFVAATVRSRRRKRSLTPWTLALRLTTA